MLFYFQDVTEAEGMELFSKEAVEGVQSLSEELNTVKTHISKVGDEWQASLVTGSFKLFYSPHNVLCREACWLNG